MMKRRRAIRTCAGLATAAAFPLDLAAAPPATGKWLPVFASRWEVAVDYSLKILDALPASATGFQPIAEQRPFGQQFTHAAYWNAFYAGSITGTPPPPEPPHPDHAAVKAYFTETSADFSALIHSLKEQELYEKVEKGANFWGKGAPYWQEHTVMDMLLRAYMHTTHHRAQAIVYLRLKGVEPPFFQF